MDIRLLTFIITIVDEILLGVSLVITLLMPKYRIWPPPSKRSWQFFYTWGIFTIAMLGIVLLSIIDWNNFLFSHWSRYPFGLALLIAGLSLALWAVMTLSTHSSLGLKGKLITYGPYKYTRNPQYLGDIIMIAGLIVLANSFFVLITGIVLILWFILAPLTEEPWLREEFGEEYDKYCGKVRRFI